MLADRRALRQRAVLWRKVTYGTGSEAGSRYMERLLTAMVTLLAQNRDVFAYLVAAHNAHVVGEHRATIGR